MCSTQPLPDAANMGACGVAYVGPFMQLLHKLPMQLLHKLLNSVDWLSSCSSSAQNV